MMNAPAFASFLVAQLAAVTAVRRWRRTRNSGPRMMRPRPATHRRRDAAARGGAIAPLALRTAILAGATLLATTRPALGSRGSRR